jgi:cytoskeletal protein RodZ
MLPSQFTRPKGSRSHMYRRGRRRRLPLVLALLAVLAAGLVAFKWFASSTNRAKADSGVQAPSPADAAKTSSNDRGDPATASPKKTDQSSASQNSKLGQSGGGGSGVPPTGKIQEKISMGGPPPSAAASNQPPKAPSSNEPASKSGPPPAAAKPAGSNPAPGASVPSSGAGTAPNPTKPPAQPPPPSTGTGTKTNTPPSAQANTDSSQRASQRVQAGLDLIAQNKPIEARRMLSLALQSRGITPVEFERIRSELTQLNQRLVFSPEIIPGDPFVTSYTVESGDSLAKVPKKFNLHCEYLFLKRINSITDERRLRIGQRLKLVTAPFHVVIDKSAFRMDLYMGDASGNEKSEFVYVRSFRVGLGEYNATPEGVFTVKPESKLINPAWANPRTGEQFAADDPKNPLGEYWIGLVGESDNVRGLEGYGIHGTIDPDSIGQMKSMGCIRLLHDDVALIYEVLMSSASTVTIRGEDYP